MYGSNMYYYLMLGTYVEHSHQMEFCQKEKRLTTRLSAKRPNRIYVYRTNNNP